MCLIPLMPKTIHYCWFGRKPLPKLAKRCIASWRKFLPEYEIKEWNEDNFDINLIPYTEEAYKLGKYAFVSDYARYWILFRHGGIYFDTDVEVIKDMDDIIAQGPFMGIERDKDSLSVAPGLGMGADPGMEFYRKMLNLFEDWSPGDSEGVLPALLVKGTTALFIDNGFKLEDKMQTIDGITIYPNDYFNPMDDYTGKITLTQNTRSIHYYAKSWIENYGPIRNALTQYLHRVILLFK